MRVIKFRGKVIETDEWIYGDLIQRMGYMPSIMYLYESSGKVRYCECAVKRETVGQFTGLFDKKGELIYEGDILRVYDSTNVFCEFRHGAFGYIYNNEFHPLAGNTNYTFNPKNTDKNFEVIGNILDNPELLKEELQ